MESLELKDFTVQCLYVKARNEYYTRKNYIRKNFIILLLIKIVGF